MPSNRRRPWMIAVLAIVTLFIGVPLLTALLMGITLAIAHLFTPHPGAFATPLYAEFCLAFSVLAWVFHRYVWRPWRRPSVF